MISKGIAVHDPERAAGELVRFLQAQWRSGMVPNEAYFRGHAIRGRLHGRHPDSPRGLTTSGITQPPMIVRSALEVGRRLDPDRRAAFYTTVFPRLKRLCRWVLDERVRTSGLAVLIHPYETGMDNRIDLAEAMAAEWLSGDGLIGGSARRGGLTTIDAIRRFWGDLRTVPVGHRSSNRDVLAAYLQTRHIRRLGYDLNAIEASGRGLLIEDVGFNAVLVDAFCCLEQMADDLAPAAAPELTVEPELRGRMHQVATRLQDLWRDGSGGERGGYHSRNHRTGELDQRPTIAGLYPLLVNGPAERTAALTQTLVDRTKYWTLVPPPSAPIDSAGFVPSEYWRGAAWSFPTDILETGLELRGEHEVAGELRRKYLARPCGAAHAEYENPLTGQPLGARPFSPAAALTLRFADQEGR